MCSHRQKWGLKVGHLSVSINLIPHSGREGNELLCEVLHLPEPRAEVADLLTSIIDVVDQGLVVGLKLLRVLVVVLLNARLDAEHQVRLLVLEGLHFRMRRPELLLQDTSRHEDLQHKGHTKISMKLLVETIVQISS